jgi:hypothetical protein
MKRTLQLLALALLLFLPARFLAAHVRLIHPSNFNPLRWSSPSTVGIVVNSTGSADVTDGSHETALRLAIQDWNAVTGTTATLVEDASPASQARTDWEASDLHLVYFDETNESGFFPLGSSTVALTPIWFYSSGVIQDADILFNGSGHQFTTSQAPNRFDIQDVAAHELGHLLGLDHTGWAGGTMYPYVDETVILHRSLSDDEWAGLRDAYPSGSFGRITGTIERASDGSAVSGAHVVAVDASGRTAAGILCPPSGVFLLRGLAPGTYTVYARPLDAPVSENNLGSGYQDKIDTDFEPAVYAANATITGSETIDLGALVVGADTTLSLGTASDRFPLRVVEGASQTVTLHGVGLFNGSTLEASDPDLLLGVPVWFGPQVTVQVTVPLGEPRGHVDLRVTSATGKVSILPAALEVTPPSPVVSSVTPPLGGAAGGTALTLTGSEFHAGARIVIGDQIYTDGVSATVVDESTITLTTAAMVAGQHDVVVLDPSGVEGRLVDGFTAISAPEIRTVFPEAGVFLGGTEVVVAGEGFLDGLAVRIDGVDQGAVTVDPDGTRARFTTFGGPVGGPYVLELENPDGALASQAFAYAAGPDPTLTGVDPGTGSAGGGSVVTITGANFSATAQVFFGADPETGEDGVAAASVTFVDASTLEVETPQHPKGLASVMVLDGTSGQGVILADAFTFTGGGGGGGCYTVPVPEPPGVRRILEGAWWVAAVLLVLAWRARRARAAAA